MAAATGNTLAKVDIDILNQTNGSNVKLHTPAYNWSGSGFGIPPSPIPRNQTDRYTHKGELPSDGEGSMGAVLYSGSNTKVTDDYKCGWLVAWHIPYDGGMNKVYLSVGAIDVKFHKFDEEFWRNIKNALKSSSTTNIANVYDETTHCLAKAEIKNTSNITNLEVQFEVKQIYQLV